MSASRVSAETGRSADGSADGSLRPWYGLVALPPPAIERGLRRLQAQLAVPPTEGDPHITLKMPFQVTGTLREVVERIERVARRTEPIDLSLAGIGGFPGPYMNAIYATVEPNPRLMALHTELVEALCGAVENVHPYTADIELHSYVPHITLASDLTDEQFEHLMARLRGRELRGHFELREMSLMRRDAHGRWRGVRTFPLGG